MVNFHGCTLPRGWSRTYPHLMSMEAVRGEECYSFDKQFPTEAPVHNVILPFTRNVVGPMDYTPVMFQDNVYPPSDDVQPRAGAARDLRVRLAPLRRRRQGVPRTARGPEEVPAEPSPPTWDDTKFLAGEPGEYVVLARRAATPGTSPASTARTPTATWTWLCPSWATPTAPSP